MTSDGLSSAQAGMRRATLLGTVAGLRSQMPLACLARAVAQGEVTASTGMLGDLLRSPKGQQGLQLAAAGEALVDKLPFAPSRLKRGPLLGRIGFGALAAAAFARTQGVPAAPAALRGATGAGIASVAGYAFRVVGTRVMGWPSLVVALAEDALAIGLARSAIRPEMISELAAEVRTDQPATPEPAREGSISPGTTVTPDTLASEPPPWPGAMGQQYMEEQGTPA